MSKKNASSTLSPQSIWDEEALLDAFEQLGINKMHHDIFMRELYNQWTTGQMKQLSDFKLPQQMTPKLLKITQDTENWALMTTKVIRREDSRDKSTTKLLIELQDGEHIETVLMRYSNTQTQEHTRTTICVSSQVGCAQACSFCATGMLGLARSLTQGEILEQFVWCDSQIEQVRNCVFMGQGEPLANDAYQNVLNTVKIMTANTRFSLRQNRVTVSTVGANVDNIYRIIDKFNGVTIALSLHAPTQTMRQKIVPAARKTSLKELVDCIDYYYEKTSNKMLIEYVMLDDVNSSEETAHQLGQLLQNRGALINLIPFNPVLTKAKHVAPSHETVGKFAAIVASYGLVTTTRKEFGQDINGACGQLSSGVKKTTKKKNTKGYMITDDFTADEVAVIVGYEGKPEDKVAEKKDEQKDDDDVDDEEDEEEDDVVENGLEGIVSAFGWMNPGENNQDGEDGAYVDNAEIGVTRESILDNRGCGGDDDAKPKTADIEDLLTTPTPPITTSPKPKPAAEMTEAEKIAKQKETPVCEANCGCHRELKHQTVTQGIDPKDNMKWSLAVLSLGPLLKQEQLATLKKKGETDRARIKRLFNQQSAIPEGSELDNDENMDQCVAGDDMADEERDTFDESSSVGTGRFGGAVNVGDNMSQRSGMTNVSMTSSQWRAGKGPVSSLKIQPRDKDLIARIVMPKKEAVDAAKEKPQMDLDKANWDAAPETYRHDDDVAAKPKVIAQKQEQQQDEDELKKKIVLSTIVVLAAFLFARRFM